jgi:multidrug resistance protein
MVKRIDEKNQGISTLLAFALLPLAGFATDIYLPSLPSMALSLGETSIEVQFTLTIFLISYGLSQLFIGSILDSFGRYRIGIVSLFIFAVSSFIIANTSSIWIIYCMRILHGITAAAVVVAKRAYFVDVFSGDRLKNYLSLFSIIWSTGPIIAPFIGGYLQASFGWQSNFYFLGGMAALLMVLEIYYNGESLKHFTEFSFRKIANIYVSMLSTVSFMLGLIVIGISYSIVMVYNMTGPFIIEHHLLFTPVTAGYCSLILGFAWMVGGFIGKATINRSFTKKLMLNLILQICFTLLMLLSIRLVENIYSLVIFAFLIHVGAGFAFNVYFTYCLSKFPGNAGIASGLTGGVMYIIVSVFSYGTVYLIPAKDQQNLSISYLLLISLMALVMWAVSKAIHRKPVTAGM